MHYTRSIRKNAIAKRVIISWLIVALFGFIIGGLSGYILKTHISAKNDSLYQSETVEHEQPELLIYGSYEARNTNLEAVNWFVSTDNFKPLDVQMGEELQEYTYYLSAAYGIDFTLVMAVIQHESKFQTDVVSNTNDFGLMQINQMNHSYLSEILGLTDILDPYQNIRAGVFILRKLFEKYNDTNMVLMAYNMGETGAMFLWDKGIYSTGYTDSILDIQYNFNK